MTRRGLLRGAGALAAITAFPGGAAAERIDESNTGLIRRELRHYSEDPNHKGIGIFINLQADVTFEEGRKLGENLKSAFASRGVPVEYRLNQSRGKATDFTFYVNGEGFEVGLPDLKRELRNVLAHHGDAWPPQTSALVLDQ